MGSSLLSLYANAMKRTFYDCMDSHIHRFLRRLRRFKNETCVHQKSASGVKMYKSILDEHLTFLPHFNKIYSRFRGVVAVLSQLKNVLDTDALLKIYFTQFHIHLFTAIPLWENMPECEIRKLQSLQNRALKQAFKLPPLTHTDFLFTEKAVNILPVRGIFFYATSTTFFFFPFFSKLVHKIGPSSLEIEY